MPDSGREKSLAGVVNLLHDPRSPLHSGCAVRFTSRIGRDLWAKPNAG